MKVAIVGSRDCKDLTWQDMAPHIPRNCALIISGGASGVDMLAQEAAEQLHIPFEVMEPDYTRHQGRAPLVRNTAMVQRADLVLAFWDLSSRGTAHTLTECIRLQVPLRIIPLGKAHLLAQERDAAQ